MTIPLGSGLALEGALAAPPGVGVGVVVCHPHPLYGGDMHSPVVLAAVSACAAQGLATLRFNFRGVGGSGGSWDEGRGEREDVRAALAHLRGRLGPEARVGLAGYSFGAAMAAAVAGSGEPVAGLALIAPPLASPGWRPPTGVAGGPVVIVAGSEDTHCPAPALAALARAMPAATVVEIPGADHFFGVGQGRLHEAVAAWAARLAT